MSADKALQLLRSAYRLRLERYGPQSKYLTAPLANLAVTYASMGEDALAGIHHAASYELLKATSGPSTSETLYQLSMMANYHFNAGRLSVAEAQHNQTMQGRRKSLGAWHPDTVESMRNVAALAARRGDILTAYRLLRDAVAYSREWSEQQADAAAGPERTFLAIQDAERAGNMALSLALKTQQTKLVKLAAEVVLHRKGLLGAREADLLRLIKQSQNEEARRVAVQLIDARQDLSIAFGRHISGKGVTDQALGPVFDRINQLERQLTQIVPDYRKDLNISVEAVRSGLPPHSVLIEFIRFLPYDFDVSAEGSQHRFAALVIKPGDDPKLFELGASDSLVADIEQLDRNLGEFDATVGAARRLYSALLEPVEPMIGNAQTIYLAPSGILGHIPFDLLLDSTLQPLWQSPQQFRIVASGRAFVSPHQSSKRSDMVIFADVDFDETSRMASDGLRTSSFDLNELNSDTSAIPRFTPLPFTATEADEIAALWHRTAGREATRFSGRDAVEENLSTVSPQILHFATHGFVIPSERTGRRFSLQVGLALAGANADVGGRADGLLLGYEIEALDLRGTELVVVSACQTGRGQSDAYEGVYSLARAFRNAGAKATLVTLKPVDDRLTARFIADFYQELLGSSERNAALALSRTKELWAEKPGNLRHARNWAVFVLIENSVSPE